MNSVTKSDIDKDFGQTIKKFRVNAGLTQEQLSEKFGTKIKIKNNKVEISFVNRNDLNRILEIIGLDN